MTWWIKWAFEMIEHGAKAIAELDYLYFEWIFDLVYPFLFFILLLFLLPFAIVFLTFAASLYIFIKKHWLFLMVSESKKVAATTTNLCVLF